MPFRLDEFRAKIQFVTFARMPKLIYEACRATDTPSNTRYIQMAVCAALSRDLGLDYQDLLNELPPGQGAAAMLLHGPRDHEVK